MDQVHCEFDYEKLKEELVASKRTDRLLALEMNARFFRIKAADLVKIDRADTEIDDMD